MDLLGLATIAAAEPELDLPVFEVPDVEVPEASWLLPSLLLVAGLAPLALGPLRAALGSRPLAETRWFRALRDHGIYPRALQVLLLFGFGAAVAFLAIDLPRDGVLHPGLVLVWGLWWNLFLLLQMFAGRFWCSICPVFFLSSLAPRARLGLRLPSTPAASALAYLGLGIGFAAIGIEADNDASIALLAGLVVAGVGLNRLGPGYWWCFNACPAVLFSRLFSRFAFLVPKRLRDEPFSCVLSARPVEGTPPPGACNFCFKCGRVSPELRIPHDDLSVEPRALDTVLVAAAWTGTLIEVARSRTFWASLLTWVKDFGLGSDLVSTGALAALGFGAIAGIALLLAGRANAAAAARATLPLLLAAIVYMVLFSISLHGNWIAHYLQSLLGADHDAAYRLREGLYAPMLWNAPTMEAAGLALLAAGAVHSARTGWARRGRGRIAALALIALLAAALGILLTRAYLTRGC